MPVKHGKQEQGDNRKDIHTDMRDAKKKTRKQTVGKPKEDLNKPVKVKAKPEPKHEGRWVRVDRRTTVFVKDGQDVDEVVARYSNTVSRNTFVGYDDFL